MPIEKAAPAFGPLAIAAALALAVAAGSPGNASAQQSLFLQRMALWEQQTGRQSRITVYARLETLGLPIMLPTAELNALQRAMKEPFEDTTAPLRASISAYEPAFAMMESAWSRDDFGRFPAQSSRDPAINFILLRTVCELLCARAQTHVEANDMDAALRDLSTVWLAGYSVEHADGNEAITSAIGMSLRQLALDHLVRLLEKKTLNLEQRGNLGRVLTSQRAPAESLYHMADRETRFRAQEALARTPGSDPAAVWRGVDLISRGLLALASSTPKQRMAFDWDATLRAAEAQSKLAANCAPKVMEIARLQEIANAKENVILTALLIHGANTLYNEIAQGERLQRYAGPLAARMIDPFTGEPLRVENKGGARFSVRSAGPDGQFDSGGLRYDSTLNVGDIFIDHL